MRRAWWMFALLMIVVPFGADAATGGPEAAGEVACAAASGGDLWASLTAPEGSVFAAEVGSTSCDETVPCSTVLDCPCPDSRCACVSSSSCGQICLCRTECFDGGDPP